MNKRIAGLSLAAAAGFTVLSAAPALASGGQPTQPPEPPKTPYTNCSEAAAEGVYNIPTDHPRYGTHLDEDMDGIGCEDSSKPMATWTPAPATGGSNSGGSWMMDGSGAWTHQQVGQVPTGGAGTGITEEPQQAGAGVIALGGGLVLAAAAGGTYAVRRHRALQG
ncbi:Excalibur calcium-binding domain protein [Arthrobacter saudimassiliensis]|uniref:Excalibur calcium-binding domain protein n=1 Tax=Arthrobacter saudimassiliensis TaxID=1461584 RepID=A0A078MQB4_9MICC|nr:Excalibur calcium-binding domain protein [Arthrobacter saudimassiliensis]